MYFRFVDDVMFSDNGPCGTWRWQYRRDGRSEHLVGINFQRIRQVAPQCLTVVLFSGSKLHTGGEVCCLDCLFANDILLLRLCAFLLPFSVCRS